MKSITSMTLRIVSAALVLCTICLFVTVLDEGKKVVIVSFAMVLLSLLWCVLAFVVADMADTARAHHEISERILHQLKDIAALSENISVNSAKLEATFGPVADDQGFWAQEYPQDMAYAPDRGYVSDMPYGQDQAYVPDSSYVSDMQQTQDLPLVSSAQHAVDQSRV